MGGKPGIDFLGSAALVQQFAVEHFGWSGALDSRLEQVGVDAKTEPANEMKRRAGGGTKQRNVARVWRHFGFHKHDA